MTLMSPFLQSHFSRAYLYMQYKTAPQSHQFKCYETFRLINSRDGAPVVVSGSLFCLCFFDKYRFIFKVVLHLSVSVEYVWTVLHWTFFLMMRKHEKQRLWFQDGIGRFSVKRRTHFYITCCKLMKFATYSSPWTILSSRRSGRINGAKPSVGIQTGSNLEDDFTWSTQTSTSFSSVLTNNWTTFPATTEACNRNIRKRSLSRKIIHMGTCFTVLRQYL